MLRRYRTRIRIRTVKVALVVLALLLGAFGYYLFSNFTAEKPSDAVNDNWSLLNETTLKESLDQQARQEAEDAGKIKLTETCRNELCFSHPTDWTVESESPFVLADSAKRQALSLACPARFSSPPTTDGAKVDRRDLSWGWNLDWSSVPSSGSAQAVVRDRSGGTICSISVDYCSVGLISDIMNSVRRD